MHAFHQVPTAAPVTQIRQSSHAEAKNPSYSHNKRLKD